MLTDPLNTIDFELQQRAFGKGLEDAGISDPHALDKNYWIQRVGEVSTCNMLELPFTLPKAKMRYQ